jgi:pimeloyl-ACP methyl ester carboxylesterase
LRLAFQAIQDHCLIFVLLRVRIHRGWVIDRIGLTPPNPEYHQLVGKIDVPILLVIGDAGIVSLETARELQSLNPRIRVELIPDAGHGIQYDQPERFEAVVRPFLRALVAPQ